MRRATTDALDMVVVDRDRVRSSVLPQVTWRTPLLVVVAALAGWVYVVGAAPGVWVDFINLALIASLAAIGLNILVGHVGIVSIGNAAFYGIGALVASELSLYGGVTFIGAVLLGAVAAAAVGALMAIPSLRLGGLYVSIGTLALHFIVVAAMQGVQVSQVGSAGYQLPVATLFGYALQSPISWYPFLSATLVIVLLMTRQLLLTKPGRAWHIIREQSTLAEMSGLVVWRYKTFAFAISSWIVGLAGGLFVFYIRNLSSENLSLDVAINGLAMVIIGGMGSIYGPIAGAFFLTCLPAVMQSLQGNVTFLLGDSGAAVFLIQGVIIGLAMMLVILVEPRGLAAMTSAGLQIGKDRLTQLSAKVRA